MKRSTYDGATVVYQYGCPHWADLGEAGMEQFRLAHRMRNELVEIERTADEAYRAAKREAPEFAAADDAYEAARLEAVRLTDRIKAERQQDRTTKPRSASKQALDKANAALKQATAARTAALAAVPEAIKRKFAEVWDKKRELTGKPLYQKWVAQGLGWATVGAVRDDMQQAVKAVIKRRKKGLSSELRFRGWRGEGTLTIACQQQVGKARRVEWEILGDHPRHKTLRLRIGRARDLEPCWLELPFVYHRPLPCDPQEVTDVQVTRRMVAGRPRLAVCFTCRVPSVKQRSGGAALAVGIGWKRTAAGLLVARIAASQPLAETPPDLAPLVQRGTPRHASVCLPQWYTWPLQRADDVRSMRDRMLEELRAVIVAAMADPAIRDAANGDPSKWRAPARFVGLYLRVPADHPLHPVLATWYRRDRHLWQFQENERDQIIARRNDAYRKLAAWLVGQAEDLELAVLPDTEYAELKRRPEVAEDPFEARKSRRQMQIAAPGLLRLMISQAARKYGVQIMMAGQKGELAHAGD